MLWAPAFADTGCPLPPQDADLNVALPHSAAALAHHHLTIVAIGSSSTLGTGASGPSSSYPADLQRDLAALLPKDRVDVLNRGVRGEDVFGMLQRVNRDVIAPHPDLIIWQFGTNYLLGKLPVDQFQPAVRKTIALMRLTGADIVLLNPQYTPWILSNPALQNVLTAFKTVASQEQVGLISRYSLMQSWAKTGQFTPQTMLWHDHLHMNDASYACLAEAIANGIVDGVRKARPGVNRPSHAVTSTLVSAGEPAKPAIVTPKHATTPIARRL